MLEIDEFLAVPDRVFQLLQLLQHLRTVFLKACLHLLLQFVVLKLKCSGGWMTAILVVTDGPLKYITILSEQAQLALQRLNCPISLVLAVHI